MGLIPLFVWLAFSIGYVILGRIGVPVRAKRGRRTILRAAAARRAEKLSQEVTEIQRYLAA